MTDTLQSKAYANPDLVLDRVCKCLMDFSNTSSGQSTPKRNTVDFNKGDLRLDTLSLAQYDSLLQSTSTPTNNQFKSLPSTSNLTTNNQEAERLPSNFNHSTHGQSSQTQSSQPEYNPGNFPPEIIRLIIKHLYFTILPSVNEYPNPDPHLEILPRTSHSNSYSNNPTFAPTPTEEARLTFTRLALVDTTWGAAATDFLWKSVGFGIPRAFESVLRTIEEYSTGRRINRAERLELAGSSGWSFESLGMNGGHGSNPGSVDERGRKLDWSEENKWSGNDGGSGFTMIRKLIVLDSAEHAEANPSVGFIR